MGALVWLLIPAVAAVCAAVWARWAARKRTTHDGASLAGYERFRSAMEAVPDRTGRPAAAGEAAAPEHSADGRQPAATAAAEAAGAPATRGARRRRIIVAGRGAHSGHGAGHSRRTASAQAAAGAGEED